MGNKSDTVYEYKKVKPIDMARAKEARDTTRVLMNKINELCIEQNHLMKDFELYKKAFKSFVTETREGKYYVPHIHENLIDYTYYGCNQ